MALNRSALHSTSSADGEMQEQPGREMPAAHTGPAEEFLAITNAAAVCDASNMGQLKATGADALDLLNRLSTNKVDHLQTGHGAPTVLTTDRGRILDVITVLHAGDHVLLLTSPGLQQTVIEYLDKYTIMEDLSVEDVSPQTSMAAVWGPESRTCVEKATGIGLTGLPLYHTVATEMEGSTVRIVSSSMSDLPGYFLIAAKDAASGVWQRLVDVVATSMGADTLETARINKGLPVHGREVGEDYNPLEAGLIGAIDFTKGCYIGQEVIARLDSYQKVQKYLVTLAFAPDAEVSTGSNLGHEGKIVGIVTSVTSVPSTGQAIGLGYVRTQLAVKGMRLEVETPGSGWAEIQDLPQMFGPGQE